MCDCKNHKPRAACNCVCHGKYSINYLKFLNEFLSKKGYKS